MTLSPASASRKGIGIGREVSRPRSSGCLRRSQAPRAAHTRGQLARWRDFEAGAPYIVRFVESRAKGGFLSPADDYLDQPLDFDELLIRGPVATFAARLSSDSMTGAGLF